MSKSIEKGKEVVRIEAEAVRALEERIGNEFEVAVDLITGIQGRVIITGMGKSGLIARKIVATMNSTGTPAIFMHPSDAVHGDLGMVRQDDVVICISKSGNTEEVIQLLPMFKRIGVSVISIVGNKNSKLARESDVVLDASVDQEACPYDLAPTSSTTAALVLGDALAIALLERKNFTEEQFAMYHPGGILGKRLFLKVDELMVKGKNVPIVREATPAMDTIVAITSGRLGATCVVNQEGILTGIITDGDLRRYLQKNLDLRLATAGDMMTHNPKTVSKDILAVVALEEMEQFNITQLVVIDSSRRPIGMIHLHDLVKAGLSPKSEV
ncbi:MAG: KpsF/GutQ family sugar-phosphate isomerase [Candidatus Kryptoniota bacterium]